MIVKNLVKIAIIPMCILTIIYISTVVYTYADSNSPSSGYGAVHAAFENESETSPAVWYTPEQLGIYKIIEHGKNGSYWLHVVVDYEKAPFSLSLEQPVFKYKGKFYKISDHRVTPGLPEHIPRWPIPIGIIFAGGWAFFGALCLKKRRIE